MQNILPVLCFIAGFGLAWLIWHGRSAARAADLQARLETERKSADEKMALMRDLLSGTAVFEGRHINTTPPPHT